jgi:hypothetical protein
MVMVIAKAIYWLKINTTATTLRIKNVRKKTVKTYYESRPWTKGLLALQNVMEQKRNVTYGGVSSTITCSDPSNQ